MPTFVGEAPVAGTVPGDIPTPPGSTVPDDADVTHEYAGTATIAALQTYLDGVPNGATVGLVASTTFTGGAAAQLEFDGRSGLTIVGRGSTLQRTSRGTDEIIQIHGECDAIRIFDLGILGANPSPGTWNLTYEHEHGIAIRASTNIELSGLAMTNIGGDFLYVAGVVGSIWSANVRMHDSVLTGNGRMGVSITDGGRDVVIDLNTFDNVAYYTLDFEPNGATIEGMAAGALDVRFSDNVIQTKAYGTGTGGQPVGLAFVITSASGTGPAKRIQFVRNEFLDGEMRVGIFMAAEDITVANNTAVDTFTAGDPAKCVTFGSHVTGGSIVNNTQPCTVDADFETHSGSSSITVSGNVV